MVSKASRSQQWSLLFDSSPFRTAHYSTLLLLAVHVLDNWYTVLCVGEHFWSVLCTWLSFRCMQTCQPYSIAAGFNPQFIPSLQSIITLFSRPLTQGSFLVHVLFINLFVARMCYSDGKCLQFDVSCRPCCFGCLAAASVLSMTAASDVNATCCSGCTIDKTQ